MTFLVNSKLQLKPLSVLLSTVILSLVFLCLSGCTENIRDANADEIEKLISTKISLDNRYTLSAPDLQVRHFRLAFYGYDTVDYRLSALKPDPATGNAAFNIQLDINYGANPNGKLRSYTQAKLPDGAVIPIKNMDHQTMRCQLFSNMVTGCLYRDRANFELSEALLQNSRQTGLVLTLASEESDYEQIDLPADYLEGLLRVVQNH